MKTVILTVILAFFAIAANSQEAAIASIRAKYNETNEYVNSCIANNVPYYHETIQNYNVPALGPQTIKTRYIFKATKINDDNPYSFSYELLRIDINYNIGGMDMHDEYLFKTGNELIFTYKSMGELSCGNTRLYYSGGKLIKIITAPYFEPCPPQTVRTERTNNFTDDDLNESTTATQEAQRLVRIFNSL